MGCPMDQRVPNLYPGHPIFTMMSLAYVWVSHMLLLQSAGPLSGGGDNTTNTMTLTTAPTIAAICVAFVILCEAGVPYLQQMCSDLNNILLLKYRGQRARIPLQSDAKMSYYPTMVHITPEGPHHTIYNISRNPSPTQLFEPSSPSNNDLIPTVSYSVIVF